MRLALQENSENVGPARAPEEADAARGRLRALGVAYLRFAFNEPGLFRLAFGPRGHVLWATVHGIAVLCLDGSLARLNPAERKQMVDRVLDTTIRGL
jgi:hypothetical protein